MIGLSLSFCVLDIANNEVLESNAEKIIAGTCFRNEKEFESVLSIYAQTYWIHNPDGCKAIARRFYKQGKIEQPRLHGGATVNSAYGYWIK